MASFDTVLSGNQATEERQQFPYRRVELTIRKFIKILEIDLDRLHKHKVNLIRFQAAQDWQSCNKEQINASRTVQQIQGTIRQLEQTRTQVVTEDLPKFDRRLGPIHEQAVSAVAEFLNKKKPEDTLAANLSSSFDTHQSPNVTESRAEWISTRGLSESSVEPIAQLQQLQEAEQQLLLDPDSIPDANTEQSWNDLQHSLVELNGLMQDFGNVVHAQQNTIDSIEENVITAQVNVEEGTKELGTAAKLKAGMFPLAGALLGGVVGGPVGLVAGLKLGGLAALGGGIIGFTGGSVLKKHTDRTTDKEMQNLNKEDSKSLPNLESKEKS